MSKPKLKIYTDGSCLKNPGVGGWGALIIFTGSNGTTQKKEISGFVEHTTNNQMELMGAIQALKVLKYPCQIELFSDSQYVIKGMSEWMAGWIKSGKLHQEDFKNKELWQALLSLSHIHEVSWNWVKGHSGHPENDRVDYLATQAAKCKGYKTPPIN